MAKKTANRGNKFVAAGIGTVASIQSEVEERFETLVVKGEAARKEYRASIDTIIDRIGDVRETVTTHASNFLNIPTSKDIDALDKKIDKLIRKVAA